MIRVLKIDLPEAPNHVALVCTQEQMIHIQNIICFSDHIPYEAYKYECTKTEAEATSALVYDAMHSELGRLMSM